MMQFTKNQKYELTYTFLYYSSAYDRKDKTKYRNTTDMIDDYSCSIT